MKNLLYLVHRVPYPPNRGDRIRSYHVLRFLSKRANVHLGCLSDEPLAEDVLPALQELCDSVAVVPVGRGRWVRAAMSALAGRTATEGLFRSRKLQQIIESWHRKIRFDAALVFCSSMIQYVENLDLSGVPVVLDLVDLDSEKWFDYARSCRGPKRFLYQKEGQRLRRLETALPPKVTAVTFVSQAETDLYHSIAAGKTQPAFAVQNGVDLNYFDAPLESADTNSHRCMTT